MRTVHVTRTIAAPAEDVFDLLADHARYDRFRGIRGSDLLSEGNPPPNGVGAMRRVLIGPLRFDEEITGYERPRKLDYLIVNINSPLEHKGGHIRLSEEGGSTTVEWRSEFRVPVPVVGPAVELGWFIALRRGFHRVLEDVERILISGVPRA
jgi:uncharacterized protein YndB with AHSA1/START domain